jgi:hypothetical protein
MSTVALVVAAMWILPIIGIVVLHARLSHDIKRRLDALGANQQIAGKADARAAVSDIQRTPHPALAGDEHREPSYELSHSGRVDVQALNERQVFQISLN